MKSLVERMKETMSVEEQLELTYRHLEAFEQRIRTGFGPCSGVLCPDCAAAFADGQLESFSFDALTLHKDDPRRAQVIAIFEDTASKLRELGFGVESPGVQS